MIGPGQCSCSEYPDKYVTLSRAAERACMSDILRVGVWSDAIMESNSDILDFLERFLLGDKWPLMIFMLVCVLL